ncbi:MAG: hypothetical protein Terrestrivirus10_10 [Terrestrivirus sp.]|uniref:dipeptidyl-peptidase III n=1 Tax=Terrestrivirus sp. TaxID=2487775 RepID=A0A3G4ZP23_9VIRU|nr:MAG: hypothetical protein Terrestrivirus10_10 [Terrestrivirus sp.]
MSTTCYTNEDTKKTVKFHTLMSDPPVSVLNAKHAFDQLTDREKQYAYWMTKASWAGSPICYVQTSHESLGMFQVLNAFFSHVLCLTNCDKNSSHEELANAIYKELMNHMANSGYDNSISEDDVNNFLQYCATFYDNMGNYLSFGDTKFIPSISAQTFTNILKSYKYLKNDYIDYIVAALYSLNELTIGFNCTNNNSQTTYYSSNMSEDDVKFVNDFMTKINMSPYNTRVVKCIDPSKETETHKYEIHVASANSNHENPTNLYTENETVIEIINGDHQEYLSDVIDYLENAYFFAENDVQKDMINAYVKHFAKGDIDDHKLAQIHWVKDKGPSVETNIGFIESYRDPAGVRGTWEGFVAVVNKEISKKFARLVDKAPDFLHLLPWDKIYEKDVFVKPDFTSLEIICFASSGIPAGINLSNYNDIRQNVGFKNVSLGNVISLRNLSSSSSNVPFLHDRDQELYKKLLVESFEVQVGLHELLGHGSGKLFTENDKVDGLGFYKEGETYNSVFGKLASAMEELRAETIGLLLSTYSDVLDIFNIGDDSKENIIYINWLNMVRSGLKGLEVYNPTNKNWGQAHSYARYIILQVLLRAGDGLVELDKYDDNVIIKLDRTKINTIGVPAVRDFLNKIQVYKSTADVENARYLIDDCSCVDEYWLKIRDIIVSKKQPRSLIIQPVLTNNNDKVNLYQFDLNKLNNIYMGHILSNILRYI